MPAIVVTYCISSPTLLKVELGTEPAMIRPMETQSNSLGSSTDVRGFFAVDISLAVWDFDGETILVRFPAYLFPYLFQRVSLPYLAGSFVDGLPNGLSQRISARNIRRLPSSYNEMSIAPFLYDSEFISAKISTQRRKQSILTF